MDRLVKIALRIITVLILMATVVSFAESYHGLFEWAYSHDVMRFWALIWPLMLDLVILVGECTVFVAIHKHWKLRHRAWAWAVTYTGLAVSTLANGGHVASHDWLTHLTNSLPPVALMFALTVGLGVLKRTRMMPAEVSRPLETHDSRETESVSESVSELETHDILRESETETQALTDASQGEISRETAPETHGERHLTDTLLSLGFKATEKSFTMPRDHRQELTLPQKRIRDMFDVDPDITPEEARKALGIAWATADKYLKATREARGLTA
jgi:Protein of unknown function (DUF2637)